MRMSQGKSEKLNRASLFATNAWRLRLSIRKKYPNLFLFGQHRYQSPFSDRLYPVSVGRQPSLLSKAFQLFHNGCKSTAQGQHQDFFQDLRSTLLKSQRLRNLTVSGVVFWKKRSTARRSFYPSLGAPKIPCISKSQRNNNKKRQAKWKIALER